MSTSSADGLVHRGHEARICTRCVMDTSDLEITFDGDGVCNHCHNYQAAIAAIRLVRTERSVEDRLSEIRSRGRHRQYDCVIGVSGGVDSSFLVLKAKEWGLRPLAIHLDNGWDSDIAVTNIQRIVTELGVDLRTHVIEWEEFRDIQLAFFRAGVVDIELPTDNAIIALTHHTAVKERIPTLLLGNNDTTEAVMPRTWNHRKTDVRNLKAIHSRFGSRPLRTLPTASTLQLLWWRRVRGLDAINILDLIEYDRSEAQARLVAEVGWRPYASKHHESVFTRFYQTQVLPLKFGIDKRRAHLSALVNAGEVDREQALRALEQPVAPPEVLEQDRRYALKKLGVTGDQFDEWMSTPPRSHYEFPSESSYIGPLVEVNRRLGFHRASA